VERRPVTFFSDGLRLDGELHLPAGLEPGERRPAIITCSGYQGLKAIHPERFARALTPDGYVCLAFDYRGFGRSEGLRGRLVPQEQCEDLRAAISFLETVSEVDPEAISLVGWALGGGVAIAAAADDRRVRSVVAINPIGDGRRSTRFMHDADSWPRLLDRVRADRRRRALEGGVSELVHPFEIVRLDTVTKAYVDDELYRKDGFGSPVSLESADFLLRFRPVDVVARIAPRPLLLIHGVENRLHSPQESHDLFARAGEPKRLELLDGSGHTEWAFDEHPTFQQVASLVREFVGVGTGKT
jgi:pimeloyl-ACP methyl ester carboxylesterase